MKLSMNKNHGIHTIELYAQNLKYTEVQKAIDRLIDKGKIQTIKRDPYNIDRHLKSTYFVEDGVRLRMYQSHDKSNGIGFIINPGTLLSGKYQPVKLWKPTSETVDELLNCLREILKKIGLDFVDPKSLSLSQMDMTQNNWGDDNGDPTTQIRLFRKGIIPENFESFVNRDKKPNPYLYVIGSRCQKKDKQKKSSAVVVKVYDKIYELKSGQRCPKGLVNKKILRFEVSMKRERFLKKLCLEQSASLYEMLRAGYDQGETIIADYQRKMYPFAGKAVTYEKAKQHIKANVKDNLLQEQMLYLLRKTSDSAGVSTAVRKLKDDYKDVNSYKVKRIFAEFDRLGIAPVTLPES